MSTKEKIGLGAGIAILSAWLVAGCTGGEEGANGPTKAEVAAGKADDSVDWCEEMGWYGDGVCDTFCPRLDPDCAGADGGVLDGGGQDGGSGGDGGSGDGGSGDGGSGDGGSGDGGGWDLTLADLVLASAELVTARYEHGTRYMGWAHYDNNCFIRMRAAYYYLHFGELPQYEESEEAPQREMMDRIRALDHPVVHEIAFEVAGTLRLTGTFETDDGDLDPYLASGWDAGWTNHHAALVYTDQGPRVVDLAISHSPFPLESWQASFLPAELQGTCAMNDPDASSAILNWRIMKSLGQNPTMPDPRCSFEIKPIFRHEDGSDYSDSELFPFMWNDVHEMAVSTDFVTHHGGDVMYLMSHPEKVPLIRLVIASVVLADD